MLCLLDESGTLHAPPEGFPLLSDEQALTAYRAMILARAADEWASSLNRQGRMPTYALNEGQEANSVGALMGLRPDDWFVPAFRELGGMLMRGFTLAQYYLYWYGNEEGSRLDPEKFHMMPVAIPVGSQMVHAVGIAWAERYKGTDRVVTTFMGEGATSEGDFHEACNLCRRVESRGHLLRAEQSLGNLSSLGEAERVPHSGGEGVCIRFRGCANRRQRHLCGVRNGESRRRTRPSRRGSDSHRGAHLSIGGPYHLG